MPTLLVLFIHSDDRRDFRVPEIEAVASLFNTHLVFKTYPSVHFPFAWVDFESLELARHICSRCVLVHSVIDVFAHSSSWDKLLSTIKSMNSNNTLHPTLQSAISDNVSFKFSPYTWGKKQSQATHFQLMEDIGACLEPIKSTVCLTNPDYDLWIACYSPPPQCSDDSLQPHYFFGSAVGNSLRKSISPYRLPDRAFLGPTSMDTELSFVMANLTKVRAGSVVYDPFVGTASTLVPVAYFNAFSIGADLDPTILKDYDHQSKKRGGPRCFQNFSQYSLSRPDIIHSDVSSPSLSPCSVDAVVTDPPYGIKAGSRGLTRRGSDKPAKVPNSSRTQCKLSDFSSQSPLELIRTMLFTVLVVLRRGGRVCYWLPQPDCITLEPPFVEGFKVIADCLQPCTSVFNRRLIVLEKE
ncbi:hypothetical protein P9112_011527 [Eukaryota sp. TZLM1-RC]